MLDVSFWLHRAILPKGISLRSPTHSVFSDGAGSSHMLKKTPVSSVKRHGDQLVCPQLNPADPVLGGPFKWKAPLLTSSRPQGLKARGIKYACCGFREPCGCVSKWGDPQKWIKGIQKEASYREAPKNWRKTHVHNLGPPVVPILTSILGEGSPTKIDCRKTGTLILPSPLEDLATEPGKNVS